MAGLTAIGSGLAGALALTAVHETARQQVATAPRMDMLGMQAIEWGTIISHGATLNGNPWGVPGFSAFFFMITGFHGTHVLIGAIILLAAVVLGSAFNWSVVVLIPLGLLANAVPATPGGLGVGEAAFDSLFRLGGLSGGASVLIGWRLVMLVPAAIGLAIYLGGRKQFVTAAASGSSHG